MHANHKKLEKRVHTAGQSALYHQKFVTPFDVLVGIGWLAPSVVDLWRQGQFANLERRRGRHRPSGSADGRYIVIT